MKDPNKASVRLYSVPISTFEEDEAGGGVGEGGAYGHENDDDDN